MSSLHRVRLTTNHYKTLETFNCLFTYHHQDHIHINSYSSLSPKNQMEHNSSIFHLIRPLKTLIKITIILFLISSPNSLVNCQDHIDGDTETLEAPTSSPPSLIPDLLNFVDQRLAVVYPIIQAFKSTITSDPLGVTKTWVGADVCSYTGFYCGATPENASATAVASIDFNGFGLSAPSLDGFLDGLPDLAIFHANSNNFTGTISPKIAALPHLFELDISNNNFLGTFPLAVLAMKSLSFLDIRFNAFAGIVPPQIFTQTLDFLFLNDNNFIQILPDALGSTTAAYLTLANNMIAGPIPRSIGDAAGTLRELLLLNNLLTGCLPYELGLLKKAVLIDASQNLLTGPLPYSLRCLESVEVLSFAGNLLYGNVPDSVCHGLGNLANFSLAGNYFTSVGPACRRLIRDGVLDVRKNCIRGLPEQRSVAECALFFVTPRSCGHPSWFTLVPCEQRSGPAKRRRPGRKLVSYAALSRRRLMIVDDQFDH